MTKEEAALVLENLAIFVKDSFRFMRPEHVEQFKEAYNLAIKALKEPPADVQEVKHGFWNTKRTIVHDGETYCSECEYETKRRTTYCPNCGAKMDGRGDE